MRRRLDAELVRRGLAPSRSAASRLIDDGQVLVSGVVADKAARMVDAGEPLVLAGPPPRFVGRGGEKLAGALDGFGLDPTGLRALDAGASTGGFTDCLLQHGAEAVTALDVGHGQLHERLRADPRVEVVERTNLRHVDPTAAEPYDAVVADLSFISLRTVMEVLVGSTAPGGWLVLLVKPQFEAGRQEVARGRGVITDPEVWRRTVLDVVDAAELAGAAMMGVMVSPLHGADGNTEFLLHLRRAGADEVPASAEVAAAVDEAVEAARRRGAPEGAAT
ncbi:TlyA family RNA methyltransferase [Dermatobacter hominis]|uniref:TlyA family RNA methyltransferase n=1 Tax=Dermatobacter hominis TaxID=2884263 RepID=UPI001D0FA6A1|nr:TlyA family RNA methyltransferase [Dermatobacter hominis]UDY36241.1 TlyA family RNA methyltransferase [Dermatobacter hominis]